MTTMLSCPFRRSARMAVAAVIAALGLAGCASEEDDAAAVDSAAASPSDTRTSDVASRSGFAPRLHLTDVTDGSGIDLVMTSGVTPSTTILEVNGGGLGLIDFDGDGDQDLFVANGATLDDPEAGPGSRLFENIGDLRFRDVTDAAGIDLRRWAMGVAVGDVDGDRRDDLYVTCYGPNVLLRNVSSSSGPRFEDVTARAGVGDDRWGTSAAFGDLDGDGDLDLYVANYLEFDHENPPGRATYKGVEVMAGPHGLTPSQDVVYENLGDGTFREVGAAWGCRPDEPAFGLNVAILDFDHDGRQDVLVGNDSMANFLYRGLGGGRFEARGLLSGVAANRDGAMQATMGIAIGDVDGNGYADVFTTNFSSDTNTLHLNLDGLFFDDRTQAYGLGLISRPLLGWACGFHDLDHDGDEDLLLFNGHVYPEATPESMDSAYAQPPVLFERDGRRFRPVDPAVAGAWLAVPRRMRSAVFGDLDRDGDVDVIAGGVNEPVRVLRNDVDGGRWIVVELEDDRPGTGNPRGLGSRIELRCGDQTLRRWIVSGGGFQSASAAAAHFALLEPDGPPTLRVIWPDGLEQTLAASWGQSVLVRRDADGKRPQ